MNSNKRAPADRLLALIDSPGPTHDNWPDFLFTLEAIHDRVHQIVVTLGDGEEWLSDGIDELLRQHHPPGKMHGKLISGLIGDYPVFAALAAQPKSTCERVARAVQAQFLVCRAKRVHFKDKTKNYLKNAALGVRKFGTNDFQNAGAVAQIIGASTPGDLYEIVKKILRDPVEKEFRTALGYLRPLLKYVAKDQPSKTNKAKPVQTRLAVQKDRLPQLTDEEEGLVSAGSASPHIIVSEPTHEAQQKYVAEASPPHVETGQDTLLQSPVPDRSPTGVQKQLTERQISARAKHRSAAIKSSLQPTPSKRSTLHLPALRTLTNLTFDPKAPREKLLGDALIAIMLLTGCRPEEIYKFKILRSNRVDYPEDQFAIILDDREFRVPVRPVPQAWKPSRSEQGLYRPVEQHFLISIPTFLPIGRALVEFAEAKMHHADAKMHHKVRYEWPKEPKALKKMLSTRLSELSEKNHLYLYPDRISAYLASAVYSLEGDLADSHLLTGARADANDSRLYYYAPPVAHLQKSYDTVWKLLASRIIGKPRVRSSPDADRNVGGPYVGSAAVPLAAPIQSLNKKIAKAVNAQKVGRRDAQWAKAHHNLVTGALYLQVFWMTGIRPSRDVIEYQQYDPASGYLAVADKDNEDQSAVRLVWLLPALQVQLQVYDENLRKLAERLENRTPDELAFRFLVKESSPQLFSKKAFKTHTGMDYDFRENAHRHYIRTRLRELGVDGAYVDALMGHGGIGGDAQGHFSALAPDDMRRAIAKPLERIWRELGFGPVI